MIFLVSVQGQDLDPKRKRIRQIMRIWTNLDPKTLIVRKMKLQYSYWKKASQPIFSGDRMEKNC